MGPCKTFDYCGNTIFLTAPNVEKESDSVARNRNKQHIVRHDALLSAGSLEQLLSVPTGRMVGSHNLITDNYRFAAA